MTSLEQLLHLVEELKAVVQKLGDGTFVQSAATNRLADTAKKLGEVVKSRTPDDRTVAAALDDLNAVLTDAVLELRKVKQRVTALALHHRAIAPEDVTGVFDTIPPAPKGHTSKPPPGPYVSMPGGWRIPIMPLLRYAGIVLGSGGLGALIKHLFTHGGTP